MKEKRFGFLALCRSVLLRGVNCDAKSFGGVSRNQHFRHNFRVFVYFQQRQGGQGRLTESV